MSKEGVKVQILDRNFTIACPPGEQESVEAAAEYLNHQLENMQDQSRGFAQQVCGYSCA